MLYFDGLLGIACFCFWVFCIVDVVVADEYACRNLPKLVWLLLVVAIPDIGGLIWLFAGRPYPATGEPVNRGIAARFPEYDRPGRHIAVNPDDDEEFLRQCRARVAEQRRKAREKRNDGSSPE